MFRDRIDAGQRLAQVLRHFEGSETVVLALPRGGVVLGAEVANELRAPLGVVLVRKIGHPAYPEYAIGAVAEDDKLIINQNKEVIDQNWLLKAERKARELIEHRKQLYYSGGVKMPDVTDKTVLLVDDGMATGLTMEAAVQALQHSGATRIIVAVPVASQESVDLLEGIADEVVVLDEPGEFMGAVGAHYLEFDQVDDDEVRAILKEVHDGVYQDVAAHH